MEKHVELKNNINHSIYANFHPTISNQAPINKIKSANDDDIDHDIDDDDKTAVHYNCTWDDCNRIMNKEIRLLWTMVSLILEWLGTFSF